MTQKRNYWLIKSEPTTYSIDNLKQDKVTAWDGVRNYQARNLMRDDMKINDAILFYHSITSPVGVAGMGEVASAPYPDPTQFDEKSKYFDPKATTGKARWFLVDVKFKEKFANVVTLEELKTLKTFDDMMVTQKGSRLSVQPVDKRHFDAIVKRGSRV